MAALLIEQAGRVAARTTPDQPPSEMTAIPILASHLGFAQGRSESEALVSFRVGHLYLTFAVELSMIAGQCADLLSKTVRTGPRKNTVVSSIFGKNDKQKGRAD